MFSLKLSGLLRLKNLPHYRNRSGICFKQKPQCLYLCNVCHYDHNAQKEVKEKLLPKFPAKSFCTKSLPKHADIFGDLGYNEHQKIEMDEDELEEEKFTENEVSIPKWQKLSPGQYARLIKSHLGKGDLTSALGVLDIVKSNRDKPDNYMYNLIIRAFALQGNLKMCFKLYNDMKRRSLTPNSATYNSLLNACATSKNTKAALEHLRTLRQLFYEKQIPLNETHYNTMIKAYGWQGRLFEALEIADEMVDKKIFIGDITYGVLLHAAIGNKESGLRYALTIWHMMQLRKRKRSLYHYNLLLRAIRDTKLGVLNVNDILIPEADSTKVCFNANARPDLLASPPVLSALPAALVNNQVAQTSDVTLVDIDTNTTSSYINDVLLQNRLILFGGYEKILKRMEADNVKPDAKTATLLMEMLPNSVTIEDSFIKYVHTKDIKLDVSFYNVLIRKRALRHQYEAAKQVLKEMQRHNLSPDIITFGVLSYGCKRRKDGLELLEGMTSIGYTPNSIIIGTLINGACKQVNFDYVLDLLKYMVNNNMKLNERMREMLNDLDMTVSQSKKGENKRNYAVLRRLDKEYKAFKGKCKDVLPKLQKKDTMNKK